MIFSHTLYLSPSPCLFILVNLGKGIGSIVSSTTVAIRASALWILGILHSKQRSSSAKGRHYPKTKNSAGVNYCVRFSNQVKVEKCASEINCVRSTLRSSMHALGCCVDNFPLQCLCWCCYLLLPIHFLHIIFHDERITDYQPNDSVVGSWSGVPCGGRGNEVGEYGIIYKTEISEYISKFHITNQLE